MKKGFKFLLLASLFTLASCSSSSIFGKYSFLVGVDKPSAPHLKIVLDLTDQKAVRPVTEDSIQIIDPSTPYMYKNVNDKFNVTAIVSIKSSVFDISKLSLFTSNESLLKVGTPTLEPYEVTTSQKVVWKDIECLKDGQLIFEVAYNDKAFVYSNSIDLTIGDYVQAVETEDKTTLLTSVDIKVNETKDVLLKCNFKNIIDQGYPFDLNHFSSYSEDQSIASMSFKSYEKEGDIYYIKASLKGNSNGNTLLAGYYVIGEKGEETERIVFERLSNRFTVNVSAAQTITTSFSDDKKYDYYQFTFVIESTMASNALNLNAEGGYHLNEDGTIDLDIFKFGQKELEVIVPAGLLNSIVEFRYTGSTIGITIPVSLNDLMKQIQYRMAGGKGISPEVKTVFLELSKGIYD